MEQIDLASWPRREIYEHFSRVDYPFYAVTVPLDVTDVHAAARTLDVSFYHLMVWLCTRAVNRVPEFNIRLREGRLCRLDRTDPSFTHLAPGSEAFVIITLPWQPDPAGFCREARRLCQTQTSLFRPGTETDGLIYFSCLPWFDLTALTNEHSFDRDDLCPRLAWGRYVNENGRLRLHLSIEVNHRTIDGVHLGRLVAALEEEIAALRS